MSDNKEFEAIKVLREEHIDDHNLIRLWIVKWKWGSSPVLEKRRIWIDKEGVERTRKAVGLNANDIIHISKIQDEVVKILEGEYK